MNKAFLGIDLDLLENPRYKDLDPRAMMLYALYADRYSASLNNARIGNKAFVDDMGVFIRFTNDLASTVLHVSKQKITDFRKELSSHGLIKVVREGLKGYKIYVYPVQQTPDNVELLLPWKNHTITIKKEVSEWTTIAKINFCDSLVFDGQITETNVSQDTERTCSGKSRTSLSQPSLSHVFKNNDLIDHARVREASQGKQNLNPYKSLPENVKKSFAETFGFITKSMAIELHKLLKVTNAELLTYVIRKANGRKITNSINYLKAIISNATKQGIKCVRDMVNADNEYLNRYSRSSNSYVGRTANNKKIEGPEIPIFSLF